jgi:hypothetical protein
MTKSSSSRKNRNQPVANGTVTKLPVSPSVLKMIQAADKNTALFRDSLIVLDMSLQAVAACVDDFVCGRSVYKTTVEGKEHIDFQKYLVEFKEKLDKIKAVAETPAVLESPLVSPQDEEVHIFGGTG